MYKEMKWFITCDKCMIWSWMSETSAIDSKLISVLGLSMH